MSNSLPPQPWGAGSRSRRFTLPHSRRDIGAARRGDKEFGIQREHVLRHLIARAVGMTVLGLLATATAHAATATATIANVQVQLIDLDLSDGVAPGISFDWGLTYMDVYAAFNSPNHQPYLTATTWTVGAALSLATNGTSGHSASLQSLAGSLLSAPGWSATAELTATSAGVQLDANADQYAKFTLTPHTMLVITADRPSIQATTGAMEGAGGSTYLHAWLADESSSDHSSASFASYGGTMVSNLPAQLRASIINPGETAAQGYLQTGVYVYAKAVPMAPVPEPQTAGLLAAGLAIVGLLARRRKRA